MILNEIVENKKREVKKISREVSLESIKRDLKPVSESRSFKKAISKPGRVNIIAEIKKKSPSRGIIRQDFNPAGIGKIYEDNKADAISVLTDRKYFGGELSHLSDVSGAVSIPVLRKEFIVDEYQVYESRRFGADAILLIAAVLEKEEIARFMEAASGFGMDCLVETHTEEEIERALLAGADIIGINNRDLKDFTVDINSTLNLRGRIPPDKVVVSESGISSADDVKLMKKHNVNAVLVGECLLKENDIAQKLKELCSVT